MLCNQWSIFFSQSTTSLSLEHIMLHMQYVQYMEIDVQKIEVSSFLASLVIN